MTIALALARPEVLGIRGAAIAQACTLAVSAIARLLLVKPVRSHLAVRACHFLRLVPAAAIGAAAMFAVHLVLPEAKWLVNLVVSAGAGAVAYGVSLLAFGLKPTERRAALKVASARCSGAAPQLVSDALPGPGTRGTFVPAHDPAPSAIPLVPR